MSDTDEIIHSTNPLNPDSDGDGMLDGDEVSAGNDPTSNESLNKGKIEENDTPGFGGLHVISILMFVALYRRRIGG